MQTPIQVAKRANVSVQSIRNWTKEYADLLSPTGRGEAGARLFTDEDVDILCTIAALRKSGVQPRDVAERVRNQGAPWVIDIELQQATPNAPQSPQTRQNDALATLDVQSIYRGRFEAIERRLDARQRGDMLWHIGTGIWIGIVFSGFVLWVLWLLT